MVLSYFGGIAQLARASALQAEGRRFDSDYLHYCFGQLHENVAAFFYCIDVLFRVKSTLVNRLCKQTAYFLKKLFVGLVECSD